MIGIGSNQVDIPTQRGAFTAFAAASHLPRKLLVLPLIFSAVLLAFAWFQPWLSMAEATRDAPLVSATIGNPTLIPFAGFISSIGIALWFAAAAIALFAGLMVKNGSGWGSASVFLLALSLQSFFFGIDDLFMIHDRVAPHYDIRERYVYAALGAGYLVVSFLYVSRGELADSALLGAASAFFFVSLAADKLGASFSSSVRYLVEDGSKLFGISFWFTFCARCAWVQIHTETQSHEVRPQISGQPSSIDARAARVRRPRGPY